MPSSFVGCANIATLAHCDAVRRGHPLHQSDPVQVQHDTSKLETMSFMVLLPEFTWAALPLAIASLCLSRTSSESFVWQSAVKAGLALNPTYTISRARVLWTAMSDDPTYLAELERMLEGLRKAGVPRTMTAAR